MKKVRIKKLHFQKLQQRPYLKLLIEEGDYSNTILKLEESNEMNMKLARKIKKCLEENIDLIKLW